MAELKILLLFLIALNLQCGKRCEIYTSRPLTGVIEDYFGVYKGGNWWVYQNRLKTKKDSIFLENYTDGFFENRTSCEKAQRRTFSIDGLYLADGNKLFANYIAEGNYIRMTISSPVFSFPEFQYSFYDQKLAVFPTLENNGNPFIDSVTINGAKYYNILIGKETNGTYFFSKNTGLVGWMNTLDTFNLVNFKIF